jgi:hypothetical protein
MWQWYCRCMCPIMTNGFYVFFRFCRAGGVARVDRASKNGTVKICNKNKIRRFANPIPSLLSSRLEAGKPRERMNVIFVLRAYATSWWT